MEGFEIDGADDVGSDGVEVGISVWSGKDYAKQHQHFVMECLIELESSLQKIGLKMHISNAGIIETLNTYGASARKNSPHYTDQMEMYTKQQTKPMTLNKAEVYKNAEKIYHPN